MPRFAAQPGFSFAFHVFECEFSCAFLVLLAGLSHILLHTLPRITAYITRARRAASLCEAFANRAEQQGTGLEA